MKNLVRGAAILSLLSLFVVFIHIQAENARIHTRYSELIRSRPLKIIFRIII